MGVSSRSRATTVTGVGPSETGRFPRGRDGGPLRLKVLTPYDGRVPDDEDLFSVRDIPLSGTQGTQVGGGDTGETFGFP